MAKEEWEKIVFILKWGAYAYNRWPTLLNIGW